MKKNRSTDDPKFAEAFRWVCDVTDIQYPSRLAILLGFPSAWGTRRSWGSRPEPQGLAVIYLASGRHEVFAPQNDSEREAVEKIENRLPKQLKEFLNLYQETLKIAHEKRTGKSDLSHKHTVPPVSAECSNPGFLVIPTPLADAIVAGTADIKGQMLGANRFALTRENFALIGTSFTLAEIEDTVRLTNELNRRLRILLQFHQDDRKKVLGSLGVSLNTLLAALTAMKEVSPDAMIRRIKHALSQDKKEGMQDE